MEIYAKARRLLFPECRCLSCGEPREITPGDTLCDACLSALQEHAIPETACPLCLSPKRSGQPCHYCVDGGMIGLKQAYSPFYYGGIVQKLVVSCKFGAMNIAARPLAQAMAASLNGTRVDAMVPVPLHAQRLRERGINQASLLCTLIHAENGIPILDALIRPRKTARQSSLQPDEREGNVRGAFTCVAPVAGMRLLLVDDVRTSGSTARACASVLLTAGAAGVSLLTAAVAPQRVLERDDRMA